MKYIFLKLLFFADLVENEVVKWFYAAISRNVILANLGS
jgi:hypothetical protein